ncbi:MAG: N-acetylneuraminate synthase [Elusimicrobia bacterium]|nr:N-acetylneuraminate synthase [Elusimicrobiota bacterium]
MRIAGRTIGAGHPCFIIAEAGVNHNGSLETAKKLIDIAADAGADAVKFQTFKAEESVTASAPMAAYQKRNDPAAASFLSMLKKLELSGDEFLELMAHAKARGILCFSKPAWIGAVDELEAAGVPVYKIGSGDVTFHSLLRRVARTGKPVILSTGMATIPEIREALQVLKDGGAGELAVLHCVTSYPVEPKEANLRAISTMLKEFDCPVGYSDHTTGLEAPLASVALGACIVEKHFTLDRTMPGPDHKASLEPGELAAMVRGIRAVEAALGHGRKEPSPCELENMRVVRKSLVAARAIRRGETLADADLGFKRPGTGLPEKSRPYFVGKKAVRDIAPDELMREDMAE